MRISDWSSDVCSSDLRVHLLGDDVGRIAERSREDLGELENRSRDLAEAVPLRDRAGALDDRPESARLLGQKVAGTADRLQVRQFRSPCRIYVADREPYRPRPDPRSGDGRQSPRPRAEL